MPVLKSSRVAKSYSITFTTENIASRFGLILADQNINWTDPRNQQAYNIKVRSDLPIDVRQKQRAASVIWSGTLDLLKKAGKPLHGFRLGCNGFQGLVHFSSEEDVFELYHIRGSEEKGFTYEPNFEGFREWGVSDRDVTDLLASLNLQ